MGHPITVALFLAGIVLGISPGPVENLGPIRGQIVDVETGQPIPGAAVLVIWWEDAYTPAQMNTTFFDAQEAVTDAQGRFEVPRLTPPSEPAPSPGFRMRKPQVTYFAPGYTPHGKAVTPPDGQPFVAPTVIQMRRLTPQELAGKSREYPSMVPRDKMRMFLRAIETEDEMLAGRSRPGERPPERPRRERSTQ